jgi:ElaA protein
MTEGAAAAGLAMRWTWARFADLVADDLYDALALRSRVFVVEQLCNFLDPDGVDRSSGHLLGRDAGGRLVGYLRVVDPGVAFAEPSIGRVVTAPEVRGTGLGRRLMAEGLERCRAAWPGQGIRINAQAHLERFYAGFGFVPAGEVFIEDNIPHLPMWRAP